MRPLALMLAAAAAVLADAGCGGTEAGTGAPATRDNAAFSFRGVPVAEPAAAPEIALRDQHGKLVRLSSYRGELTIVTFLYTSCTDVCPLIADRLDAALRRLSAAGYPTNVLAVSVDPWGDTQAAVRRFVRLHRPVPRFRYLRGSAAELKPVRRAYGVAADPESSSTAVAYSAFELLIDRSGIERVYYTSQMSTADVVHDVEQLARP